LIATASAQKLATFDGVTFADRGGSLYFPVREVSKHLGWKLEGTSSSLKLNGYTLPSSRVRPLPSGTKLVDVAWLKNAGAVVNRNSRTGLTTVKNAKSPGRAFYVRRGLKRVFINKKEQTLVAYQGRRTVLRTKVSTGRKGKETPLGLFRAKGKEKMHRSRLYNNVPMPWSIHIVGNVFVHGFKSTPSNASSGCIRVPLAGSNPARWLYYWTEVGTPITVSGKWPKGARASR
jgi:hypothetical protein